MPGFDGTGPMGMGSMTGGGRGFCTVKLPPALSVYGSGYMPIPYYRMNPFLPGITPREELDYLKGLSQSLKGDLREIEEKIQKLTNKED
jgi:hypothetical protein